MNANTLLSLDDDWGYECPANRQQEPVSERVAVMSTRNFTGRERASRQSRFSRRSAPQRLSGTHRRGNKRYGI